MGIFLPICLPHLSCFRSIVVLKGDAVVGLWDVDSMVCTSTVTRCNRFIRSVSFSHDSQIVATGTEENCVDLAIPETGEFVGKVSFEAVGSRNRGSGGDRNNTPGADEISFHPKAHILACARCDSGLHSPMTIMKLKFG